MSVSEWHIEWIDGGREPQHPPDPRFPNGIDINLAVAGRVVAPNCTKPLPYPAKRCGYYVVTCQTCGANVVVTTAGRPDDPRSLLMFCRQ